MNNFIGELADLNVTEDNRLIIALGIIVYFLCFDNFLEKSHTRNTLKGKTEKFKVIQGNKWTISVYIYQYLRHESSKCIKTLIKSLTFR